MSVAPPVLSSESSAKSAPVIDLDRRTVGPALDLGGGQGASAPVRDGLKALIAVCVVSGLLALALLLPKTFDSDESSSANLEAVVDTDSGWLGSLMQQLLSAFDQGEDESGQSFDDALSLDATEADAIPESEPSPAAPVGDLYVDITNSTGFVITQIFVSPQSSTNWGSNLLDGQTLGVGETYRVNLSQYSEAIFDIKLVDVDGDSYSFPAFDVTAGDIDATVANLD